MNFHDKSRHRRALTAYLFDNVDEMFDGLPNLKGGSL